MPRHHAAPFPVSGIVTSIRTLRGLRCDLDVPLRGTPNFAPWEGPGAGLWSKKVNSDNGGMTTENPPLLLQLLGTTVAAPLPMAVSIEAAVSNFAVKICAVFSYNPIFPEGKYRIVSVFGGVDSRKSAVLLCGRSHRPAAAGHSTTATPEAVPRGQAKLVRKEVRA